MHTSLMYLSLLSLGILACNPDGEDSDPALPAEIDPTNPFLGTSFSTNPSVLAFQTARLGETKLQNLTFQNRGETDIVIDRLFIDPPAPTDWTIAALDSSGFTLIPGLDVSVTFQCIPGQSTTAYDGELVIVSGANERRLDIVCELEVDIDGDGFADAAISGGTDCDDTNPDIHPNAVDEWYDGIDANCDGKNDFDQDGDGFVAAPFNPDPTIYALETVGGGDCQDNNPFIWPDHDNYNLVDPATMVVPRFVVNPYEVWYDGVDSNCAFDNDFDADGDGFSSLAAGEGTDCDDSDPDINIDAIEMLNGKDDDCDDFVDRDVPAWNAENVFSSTIAGDLLGSSVVMGDLNKDGYDEIIVGAPGTRDITGNITGTVVVFDGERTAKAPNRRLSAVEEQNTIIGEVSTGIGTALAFYDDAFNNNQPDLAIGASGEGGEATNAGAVYVLDSRAYYGGGITTAYLEIYGQSFNQRVGSGLASNVDLNADGVNDHLGHYYHNGNNNALWLLYGDVQGSYALADVDARFYDGSSRSSVGARDLPPSGDLNGDGFEDVVYCTEQAGGDNRGQVWIMWGQAERYRFDASTFDSTTTRIFRGEPNERMGQVCGISPDIDGDEDAELWVYTRDASGRRTGFYMIEGSSGLETTNQNITDIYARRYETATTDPGALNFGLIGDWDGDDISDVGIGMPGFGVSRGRIWFFGSADKQGDFLAGQSTIASISGDSEVYQNNVGAAFSVLPGDINKDGKADFVFGDPGFAADSGSESNAGAIYVNFQE